MSNVQSQFSAAFLPVSAVNSPVTRYFHALIVIYRRKWDGGVIIGVVERINRIQTSCIVRRQSMHRVCSR